MPRNLQRHRRNPDDLLIHINRQPQKAPVRREDTELEQSPIWVRIALLVSILGLTLLALIFFGDTPQPY